MRAICTPAVRGTLILVMALAGCNSGSPPPASLTGYSIISGPGAVQTFGNIEGSLVCAPGGVGVPSGVVTGGGFSAVVQSSWSFSGIRPFVSEPSQRGAGWVIAARNTRPGDLITLIPIAVCVTRPAGYAVDRGSPTSLVNQQIGDAVASCSDSTARLLGGGFASDAEVETFHQLVNATGTPQSWTARAKSTFLVPARSNLRATAICADLLAVPGQEVVLGTASPASPQADVVITASCTAGKRVLSGGVMALDSAVVTAESFPTPGGEGWTARIHNANLGGAALSGRVVAVCATAM